MTRALIYKEFRETLGVAAIGLVLLLIVVGHQTGHGALPFLNKYGGTIPFVSDGFASQFMMVAGGLAVALGFKQSLGDFLGDAQLFLLHRPISRRRIYATKIVVGLSVYLICCVVPIALYAAWAALPGTHASPFAWSMTSPSWVIWIVLTAVYLGALLSGVRPAAWFGTRLAPLATALALAMFIMYCWFAVALAFVVLVNALLIYLILSEVRSREFA